MWKPNEEFCHIIVDTGIFDHHLPDSVQGAVERLYQHQIVGKDRLPDIRLLKCDTELKTEQPQTVRGTLDTKTGNLKPKPSKNRSHFRWNSEPDICTLEPVCRIDDINNTSEVADVKEVDENTVEVTIHMSPECED